MCSSILKRTIILITVQKENSCPVTVKTNWNKKLTNEIIHKGLNVPREKLNNLKKLELSMTGHRAEANTH